MNTGNIQITSATWVDMEDDNEADIIDQILKKSKEDLIEGQDVAIFIESIPPVALPELLYRINLSFTGTAKTAVTPFGGCPCGKCDNTLDLCIAIALTEDLANLAMRCKAEEKGYRPKGDLAEALGPQIGKMIAQAIAQARGIDPDDVIIKEVSGIDEINDLISSVQNNDEPKRTLH